MFVEPTGAANTAGERSAAPTRKPRHSRSKDIEVSADFHGGDPKPVANALKSAGAKAIRTKAMPDYPTPPFRANGSRCQVRARKWTRAPDHGKTSYKGSGRLQGKRAIITGGDSGMGRTGAIAFAREGADILIAYLSETDDAKEVATLIAKEGRKVLGARTPSGGPSTRPSGALARSC
ncbi:MAG TPA: hypothetical protein VN815_11050 [Steroidobacteraceae bacterium]|nr:hypothetical protein [Steroidobacteraceae bacterium]